MSPSPELTHNDVVSLIRDSFAQHPELAVLAQVNRIRLPNPDAPEYDVRDSVEDITPLDAMTLIAGCWERYQNGRNFYPTKLDKIEIGRAHV